MSTYDLEYLLNMTSRNYGRYPQRNIFGVMHLFEIRIFVKSTVYNLLQGSPLLKRALVVLHAVLLF